jgi:ketosteroid isomerase-like protein
MKKPIAIALLTIISTFAAFAQSSNDEPEILKIHASLDEAFMKKDIAVFERVFADDYFMSSASGKLLNRAELLADLRKEMAGTEYKMLSAATDSLKAKTSGNMGFVTGNWSTASVPSNDATAEPHKDTGRYTGIYEKRNGKWLLIAEHWSEAPHDRKLMEQQVLEMGQQFVARFRNPDSAAEKQFLADEFMFTDERGKVTNQVMFSGSAGIFTRFEISDQKARVIGNNTVVETGIYNIRHEYKATKFDYLWRFTKTWMWRDGRWQIVADHVTAVK